MIQLPKNCKVIYGDTGVFVKMVYATTLPVGDIDDMKVFKSPFSNKRYIELNFHVKYQHNMPMVLKEEYFKHKKKAMLFNRKKKQERLQSEMDLLNLSSTPGKWLFEDYLDNNQLSLNL